ncbi:MAG: TonB-dependent receptor domain-containing protein [Candidatus Longimicrobiales bacterium M2_2A_002]
MAGSIGLEAQSGAGKTGRILGRVVEQSTGERVAQAEVAVRGGPATLTDLNGRFVLTSVPAGTVALTVQALAYGSKTVTGVEVPAGGVVQLDIAVESRAIQMEEIRVSAERERGSTVYLLDERRTSNAMVEAVGSEQISRQPSSDAADVAQRMTGVTVSDGRYVFIRGLGERYSQTTLNGSSLPSPEPEKDVVPLDLFPSGFLESLKTQKSYTPDLAADFSGGSVQINTRDFPSQFAGQISVSTSFNTESQFADGFLRHGSGGTDWIGLDDGTRAYPQTVQALMGGVRSGERLPSDPQQRIAIAESLRSMDQGFAPTSGATPLNRSLSASLGGRTDLGGVSELGFFFAGTYSDKYTIRDNEIERKWRAGAFRETTAELSTPNVEYTFNRGTRTVSWGTIGNVSWKPNVDHKISLKTTVNLNTEDESRTYTGQNNEDIGGELLSQRARFVERLMLWGQLSGEHLAPLDSRLEWRVTGARANREEPLLRETIYVYDDNRQDFFLLDFTESARYFSSELVDDDLNGEVDWRIPFPFFDRAGWLKIGGAYRTRDRSFGARRLNWRFLGATIPDLDAALDTAAIVAGSPGAGEFAIDEVVEPGDVYEVTDRRTAGYAMLELPVTGRLKAVVGARYEQYDLELTSRDSTLQDLNRIDVAPALNVSYALTDDLKLRGAWSRTLDRPELRELAPFQFTEATSLRQLVGNPQLVPAEINSMDLRMDWFFGPNEILSFGGFYKDMENPIEQVFIAAASSAYSFQNAETATIYGLELDAQVGLGRVAGSLESFGLQANYSRIFSEVTVRQEGIFQPTNLERPLEGQAPYVMNAGITYAGESGVDAGVYFNRFGERLTAAGGSGLPDIYEQPRNAVDANVSFPIRSDLRVKLKGTNLFDEEHQYLQSANGYTRTQRRYTVGRTFSVGLSWEF